MPFEAVSLESSMLVGAIPVESADGQRSPVDVVTKIREDLAEFQRSSNSQAFRETLRQELREACMDALHRAVVADGPDYLDIEPLVEYFEQRDLIRSGSRRPKKTNGTAGRVPTDSPRRRRKEFEP